MSGGYLSGGNCPGGNCPDTLRKSDQLYFGGRQDGTGKGWRTSKVLNDILVGVQVNTLLIGGRTKNPPPPSLTVFFVT